MGVITGSGDMAITLVDISATLVTRKYIREVISAHRRVWEKYYKCSILPWGQIHFINGDKTDIRIENMVLLRRGGSALLLNHESPKTDGV
jgi:hypothetical protein